MPTGTDTEVLPAQEGADIFKLDPDEDLVFDSLQAGPSKTESQLLDDHAACREQRGVF